MLSPIQLNAYSRKKLDTSYLKKRQGKEDASLTASYTWFNRFKGEVNFLNIKVSGEAVGLDNITIQELPAACREIIDEGVYLLQQAFNFDETGLYWMPEQSYSRKEKRMPGFKAAKSRLTLWSGGNASGDMKLSLS